MAGDLERIARRLMGMVGIGRLTLTEDSKGIQMAQLRQGPVANGGAYRLKDNTPVMGNWGFASRPPAGADCVVLSTSGDPTDAIVIATGHQDSRLRDLGEGDAAIHDVRGAYVWLTPQGVVIDAAGLDVKVQNAANVDVVATTRVTITAPLVEVDGDLKVTGDITDQSESNAATLKQLRDAYNGHHHTDVQPGSGTSGATDDEV